MQRKGKFPFSIEKRRGNLFNSEPTASLAHCISRDASMHRGIARQFSEKLGNIPYIKAQASAGKNTAVIRLQNRSFIYYLITKEKYFQKPTLNSLERSLEEMRSHTENHGVSHICIPEIGAGLDKLSWKDVENTIREVFRKELGLVITVYKSKTEWRTFEEKEDFRREQERQRKGALTLDLDIKRHIKGGYALDSVDMLRARLEDLQILTMKGGRKLDKLAGLLERLVLSTEDDEAWVNFKQEKRLYYKANRSLRDALEASPFQKGNLFHRIGVQKRTCILEAFLPDPTEGQTKASLQSAQRVRIEMFVDNAKRQIEYYQVNGRMPAERRYVNFLDSSYG